MRTRLKSGLQTAACVDGTHGRKMGAARNAIEDVISIDGTRDRWVALGRDECRMESYNVHTLETLS